MTKKKLDSFAKGIYTEYLNCNFQSLNDLTVERKKQLTQISKLRNNRDILVFAADLKKSNAPISISYPDILPITDQLSIQKSDSIDIILETPGGSGEIAEQIIRLIRDKYKSMNIIIPGCAKSAGTIMAMAADEILMEPFVSALGPIDAQLFVQGKVFSAEALIKGFDRIKKEVELTSQLNKAYIPMLQRISPGELEHAQNALDFAKKLVAQWLVEYKFKNWTKHRSKDKKTYGKPVSEIQKKAKAKQIAKKLCNHSTWKTHGRSIALSDLEEMGLEITDYSKNQQLSNAIRRYFTLLQMTFGTTIYKIFETADTHIFRYSTSPAPQQGLPPLIQNTGDKVNFDLECQNCKAITKFQANFKSTLKIEKGFLAFPKDNNFKCPTCKTEHDLSDIRRQIELQSKKTIV